MEMRIGRRALAKKIRGAVDPLNMRMGTVTAVTPGAPTVVSATVGGASFTNIPVLDTAHPAVGYGMWFAVLGRGKLLGVGIVGASNWQTITLADAHWTLSRTPEWRLNAGRVELRGRIDRITSTLSGGGSIFTHATTGNAPAPPETHVVHARLSTGDGGLVANVTALAVSNTAGLTSSITPGTILWLDSISWPTT